MSVHKEAAKPEARPGDIQDLLLRLSTASGEGRAFAELIHLFCKETREFFGVDGVYYWRLVDGEELVSVDADGHQAERFRSTSLRLDDSAVAVEAVKSRRTVYVNHLDPQKYPMAAQYKAASLMAAPLLVRGEVMGAIVFLSRDRSDHFGDDLAARATILAAHLGSLIETLERSERYRKRAEDLMALALELSASLRLPEFARSFTERVTGMLGAEAGALALCQGSTLETIVLHAPGRSTDKSQVRRLNAALTDVAAERSAGLVQGEAASLLGSGVAAALEWRNLALVRLTGTDQELLGLLCLANLENEISGPDRTLLQAVSAHASVALENSRLFSRIAQSNRHWAEIFDSLTDFIVVHDDAYRVLRVNQSLAQFMGVRPAELIGIGMRALVSIVADAGDQPCPFCRVGMERSDEYIHPVLDRTYLVSTSRVRGAQNEGLQTIHVLKDITDRREAERRYRELLDNIQEGIFFSTPEGRFVEVNDALVHMLGYGSREELLQIDIAGQLYPAAGHRQRFVDEIERHNVVRNFEEALRRRDGTIVHTLQNAFAVRDAKGVVIQYRGVMLDISEAKAFQAQLQRERDFNTKILNNTQSMILVADTAGLVSYANRRCFEHGNFQEGELLGHQLIEFVAPQRREAMAAAFEAVLGGQQVDNLDLPMVRTDGKLSQFSINLSPMRDERGDVNAIVAVMTDITDAALLQGKLMHAEKMAAVGQLVSGVAHEVNNPLTAILGFADLLLEQPDVPESAHKNLKVIVQEAQRTKTIVQNLLSFARQMPAERRPVQVNPILRRTLQLRAYDFASHGVDIVERLRDDIPEIVGDAQQLQQVFLNIINNAYDAVRETERRGTIEVETSYVNGGIEVVFRDNGRGIQFPERIFDPFFTTKEVGKGTGLGLSICYGIVREHGGDITCHNNEGRPGASFVVRFPAAGRPVLVAATAAGAQA